jgi:Fic family protein
MRFIHNRNELLTAGKRGNRTQIAQVLLDGKYFTYAAIGAMLGVSRDEANRRYRNAKRLGLWPIKLGDLT